MSPPLKIVSYDFSNNFPEIGVLRYAILQTNLQTIQTSYWFSSRNKQKSKIEKASRAKSIKRVHKNLIMKSVQDNLMCSNISRIKSCTKKFIYLALRHFYWISG